MTFNNKFSSALFLAVAAAGVMSLASCADEPDKFESTSGKPTVKYVRCLSSEVHNNSDDEGTVYTNGQLVTQAAPGSTVAIIGENMRSVKGVLFNDQQASVNTSTLTDNVLITTIPNSVPGAVSDKIFFVTTQNDTVSYDFHVSISAPQIQAMPNEYEVAGQEVRITGNYFIDDPNVPLTVSFTGADGKLVPAKVTNIAADYTSVDVVIPEGADVGPVVATSVYGTAKSSFYYKDNRGMLFDFDTPNKVNNVVLDNHGWNGHSSVAGEGALSGKYFQFGDGSAKMAADGNTWDEGHFSFVYWPGSWNTPEDYSEAPRLIDVASFTDWENMALKFEMCIPASNPWTAGALQFCFAGVGDVSFGNKTVDIYGNNVAGANNTYFSGNNTPHALYRPWTTTGSYDTNGKWVTVSIPLAGSFIYNIDGTESKKTLSKDSFSSLWMFLIQGGTEGKECAPIIRIDNIRVVPIK